MITPDNLPAILDALLWPLLVFVFVLMFKKEIRGLVNRLIRAKLAGNVLEFGKAKVDEPAQKPAPVPKTELPERVIEWNKSGNLFWAAHDLTWTVDVLLRGAPKEWIMRGFTQSLHHVRKLGFLGTPIEAKLVRLKTNAERIAEEDWTRPKRDIYAHELYKLIFAIARLAEANQPDYESRPKE